MIIRLLTRLVLAGLYPLIWFVRLGSGDVRLHQIRFRACAELLSLAPFKLGMLLRKLYYERTLAECGDNLLVCFGAMFVNPRARVGSNVEIRPFCMVGLADIGDHVSMAQRVSVLSGRHQHAAHADQVEQQRLPAQRIHIGAGTWIGAHAVVMNDVGDGSVIGAGAVVVDVIPAWSVAVGVPARVVKRVQYVSPAKTDPSDADEDVSPGVESIGGDGPRKAHCCD